MWKITALKQHIKFNSSKTIRTTTVGATQMTKVFRGGFLY